MVLKRCDHLLCHWIVRSKMLIITAEMKPSKESTWGEGGIPFDTRHIGSCTLLTHEIKTYILISQEETLPEERH